MYQRSIRIQSIQDAMRFVEAASKFDFDIDLGYNRIVVDAKSILGVLSLDLSKPLMCTWHMENEEFEKLLCQFRAAA